MRKKGTSVYWFIVTFLVLLQIIQQFDWGGGRGEQEGGYNVQFKSLRKIKNCIDRIGAISIANRDDWFCLVCIGEGHNYLISSICNQVACSSYLIAVIIVCLLKIASNLLTG
jgi:hypothetical protein